MNDRVSPNKTSLKKDGFFAALAHAGRKARADYWSSTAALGETADPTSQLSEVDISSKSS